MRAGNFHQLEWADDRSRIRGRRRLGRLVPPLLAVVVLSMPALGTLRAGAAIATPPAKAPPTTIASAKARPASTAPHSRAADRAGHSLPAKLVSLSQLPVGWFVESKAGSDGGVGCLGGILDPTGVNRKADASISFSYEHVLPEVGEGLAAFANAREAYRRIVASLERCRHTSGVSKGLRVKALAREMQFPRYGDASTAFQALLFVKGESITSDVVIVRQGGDVAEVSESDIGSVDVGQLERVVRLALADAAPR